MIVCTIISWQMMPCMGKEDYYRIGDQNETAEKSRIEESRRGNLF